MSRFEEIQRIINRHPLLADFVGPVSKGVIAEAEQELKVVFPPSYRWFLRTYGSGNFGAQEFFGLGTPGQGIPNTVWVTMWHRKEEPTFPSDFVVVYNVGLGEIFCLDTHPADEGGECKVVRWIPGLPSQKQDFKVIASSFADLLLHYLLEQIGGDPH